MKKRSILLIFLLMFSITNVYSQGMIREELINNIYSINSTSLNFTTLSDTPNAYNGYSGFCVSVKGAENGLEFINCNGSGSLLWNLSGNNLIPSVNGRNIHIGSGNITAGYFFGDGSQLSGISGGNSSWNKTYADGLYAGIEWDYNQTEEAESLLNGSGLIKDWNATGFITNQIQDLSGYLLNTGDTATGDYDFSSGTFHSDIYKADTMNFSFTDDSSNFEFSLPDLGGNNYFGIMTTGGFFQLYANPNAGNDYLLATISETQGADTDINFYEGGTGHNRFWDSGSARFGGSASRLCSNLTTDVDCNTATTGADIVVQDDGWFGGKLFSSDWSNVSVTESQVSDLGDYYLNSNPYSYINNTTLTDNSIADALHRHSELVASDGSPDPALSVDATGRVGIGTTAPEYKLHIYGVNPTITTRGNSGNTGRYGAVYFSALSSVGSLKPQGQIRAEWINGTSGIEDSDLILSSANAGSLVEGLRITSDGNVGIGTTAPNQNLQVDGNVNVSGTIYYGSLQANSPFLYFTDDNFHVDIKKSTNGTYYLEYVNNELETIREWVDCNRTEWYQKKSCAKLETTRIRHELEKSKNNTYQKEVLVNNTYYENVSKEKEICDVVFNDETNETESRCYNESYTEQEPYQVEELEIQTKKLKPNDYEYDFIEKKVKIKDNKIDISIWDKIIGWFE